MTEQVDQLPSPRRPEHAILDALFPPDRLTTWRHDLVHTHLLDSIAKRDSLVHQVEACREELEKVEELEVGMAERVRSFVQSLHADTLPRLRRRMGALTGSNLSMGDRDLGGEDGVDDDEKKSDTSMAKKRVGDMDVDATRDKIQDVCRRLERLQGGRMYLASIYMLEKLRRLVVVEADWLTSASSCMDTYQLLLNFTTLLAESTEDKKGAREGVMTWFEGGLGGASMRAVVDVDFALAGRLFPVLRHQSVALLNETVAVMHEHYARLVQEHVKTLTNGSGDPLALPLSRSPPSSTTSLSHQEAMLQKEFSSAWDGLMGALRVLLSVHIWQQDMNGKENERVRVERALQAWLQGAQLRFFFHFSGAQPTNRIGRPEWVYAHVMKEMERGLGWLEDVFVPLVKASPSILGAQSEGTGMEGCDGAEVVYHAYLAQWLGMLSTRTQVFVLPTLLQPKHSASSSGGGGVVSLLPHLLEQAVLFDEAMLKEYGFEQAGSEAWGLVLGQREVMDRWMGAFVDGVKKKVEERRDALFASLLLGDGTGKADKGLCGAEYDTSRGDEKGSGMRHVSDGEGGGGGAGLSAEKGVMALTDFFLLLLSGMVDLVHCVQSSCVDYDNYASFASSTSSPRQSLAFYPSRVFGVIDSLGVWFKNECLVTFEGYIAQQSDDEEEKSDFDPTDNAHGNSKNNGGNVERERLDLSPSKLVDLKLRSWHQAQEQDSINTPNDNSNSSSTSSFLL